jgi:hypothetical protein
MIGTLTLAVVTLGYLVWQYYRIFPLQDALPRKPRGSTASDNDSGGFVTLNKLVCFSLASVMQV